MAYFDNAATTYPKPDCVYDFMDSFYRSSGANAGRGNYKLAQSAGALIGDTRKKIQELLHCQAKQVVFEPTATIAPSAICTLPEIITLLPIQTKSSITTFFGL